MTIQEFVETIPNFSALDGRTQVDYFAFFLSDISGTESFRARDIENQFNQVDVPQYSRIAAYLSEQASKGISNYIKAPGGYRLARHRVETLRQEVGQQPKRVAVAKILRERLSQLSDTREYAFFKEAIDCFWVQAFRAAIIVVWILTVDHLFRYVFFHQLPAFNTALAKNPDRRIRQVSKIEDFCELQESKFIELLRASDVISNDVRKLLDEKLGIRNSAAHPSDVQFDSHKATEFASDLLTNVILHFPI